MYSHPNGTVITLYDDDIDTLKTMTPLNAYVHIQRITGLQNIDLIVGLYDTVFQKTMWKASKAPQKPSLLREHE